MSQDSYKVHYARATYGQEERDAVSEVLDHPERLVGGPNTEEFEDKVSDVFGKSHGVMVNSGSSANLLAIELLDLEAGSELITPITTFSTTVAPIVQCDLVPVFVDVGIGDYQLDIGQVEAAISPDTEAIVVPSLVGNVPDYRRLSEIADENDLYLVEDSADTLGATIGGKPTGEYTDISTTSFYGSHVITTLGSGGMIAVNNEQWAKKLQKLRGWGRKSASGETDDISERLAMDIGGRPYDSKFIFDEIGYNFLPTEASAAFGSKQLEKLSSFSNQRREVFKQLRGLFADYEQWFSLPTQREDVETAWLAFPLTIKEDAPFTRREIVEHFEKNRIQTRSLWTGNIMKHPGFSEIEARLPFEYTNANKIMERAFVIGAHESMGEEEIEYVEKTVESFLSEY